MFGNLPPTVPLKKARDALGKQGEGRLSVRCGDREMQAGRRILRALRNGDLALYGVTLDPPERYQLSSEDLRQLLGSGGVSA